jgi:hypothetical protein
VHRNIRKCWHEDIESYTIFRHYHGVPHSKVNKEKSNLSLVFDIKPNANEDFRTEDIPLRNTLQEYYAMSMLIFLQALIPKYIRTVRFVSQLLPLLPIQASNMFCCWLYKFIVYDMSVASVRKRFRENLLTSSTSQIQKPTRTHGHTRRARSIPHLG